MPRWGCQGCHPHIFVATRRDGNKRMKASRSRCDAVTVVNAVRQMLMLLRRRVLTKHPEPSLKKGSGIDLPDLCLIGP